MDNIPFTANGLSDECFRTGNERCYKAFEILESFFSFRKELLELYNDVFDNSVYPPILRQDASFENQMRVSNLMFNMMACYESLKSYIDVFNPILIYQSCFIIEDVLRNLKCEEV